MCDCIAYWREDKSVEGTHSREPVTCAQVIADLRAALLVDHTADKERADVPDKALLHLIPPPNFFDFSWLDRENPQAD